MASVNSSKQSSNQASNQWSEAQSEGYNQSLGLGRSTQDVYGAQQPALGALYAGAQELLSGGGLAAKQGGLMQQATNAWANQLTPGGNPYFSQSVQGAIDQASRGFTQNVLPQLRSNATAVGQYGEPRDQLAQGQAAGQFGQDLQAMASSMYANQYAGDQQRALQAVGMAPQLGAAMFQPLTQAQGMIGGPTVLGQSTNFQSSLGEQSSWARSAGASQGNSKGRSFGMGIGSK
jgi:hypothetical protein